MASVGLIVHSRKPEAKAAANELAQWLYALGHRVRMSDAHASAPAGTEDAPGARGLGVSAHSTATDPPRAAQSLAPSDDDRESFAAGLDLVVTLGGDGSILRAVELIGESGVAILGVNFGRMGYLTEVRPRDARAALERVLAGECAVEERMLLRVRVERADAAGSGEPSTRVALNEAVVERPAASYAMRLGVSLNGEHFTTYAADGLIVATPTGSTAYALSARGPVIDPNHKALLLTPVSPHMLFDRSMVVDADTTLRLEVLADRGAVLSVDGRRQADLREGDAVVCAASPRPVRLLTFGSRRFHQVLKAKFGLNDR